MPELYNTPWQINLVHLVMNEHLLAKQVIDMFKTILTKYKDQINHLSFKYISNVQSLGQPLSQLQTKTTQIMLDKTQALLTQWQIVIAPQNVKAWTNFIDHLTDIDEDYRISYHMTVNNTVKAYLTTYQPQVSFDNYQHWVNFKNQDIPTLQWDIEHYFRWVKKFEQTLITFAKQEEQ